MYREQRDGLSRRSGAACDGRCHVASARTRTTSRPACRKGAACRSAGRSPAGTVREGSPAATARMEARRARCRSGARQPRRGWKPGGHAAGVEPDSHGADGSQAGTPPEWSPAATARMEARRARRRSGARQPRCRGAPTAHQAERGVGSTPRRRPRHRQDVRARSPSGPPTTRTRGSCLRIRAVALRASPG